VREALKGRIGNQDAAQQDAIHPVVIKHPISGKKSLYVNPGFTLRFEGWTDQESKPLLDHLYQHAARPEHTYRFQWANGSIAFWDNRATWHYAVNDYHGHRRLMHRITVQGVPVGR
jgi:taurine dioxygenase